MQGAHTSEFLDPGSSSVETVVAKRHPPLAKGTRMKTQVWSMLVPTFSTSWEGCGQKKKKKGEVRGCLATSPGAQIAHQMTYQLGLPATPGLPV